MKSNREALTANRLREILDYNPDTGFFRWKECKGQRRSGGMAGTHQPGDYIRIGINGSLYLAHRLAWLYMTGEWPPDQIDHIDGEMANNCWVNLRAADCAFNQQNLRKAYKNNRSGILGVHKKQDRCRSKPWAANIKINGKKQHIGYFASAEEAHEAYLKAKRETHPGSTI